MRMKIVFFVSTLLIVAIVSLLIGLYSGFERNRLLSGVLDVYLDFREVAASFRESAGQPVKFIQPARTDGAGVTVNEVADDGALVLVSGFFEDNNGIRLLRRDGSTVASWEISYRSLFPDVSHLQHPPIGDWNIDLHGALANPDGSVVFNIEYVGTVRLGRCGDQQWVLKHPTHHSIERSERGGYWIPGRIEHESTDPDLYPPFTQIVSYGLREDLLLRVSETGEIVEQKSVIALLYDNGLRSLLTSTGYVFRGVPDNPVDGTGTWIDDEVVHLNKIEELPAALADRFPQFEAGDLAISLRNYNLVLVVDPDDWSVKWHHTGPWERQHDPDFLPNGRISIFNNKVHPTEYTPEIHRDPSLIEGSNIMEIDPVSGDVEVVYGDAPGEDMLTFIRGKHQPLANGHTMITEFEAGRAFEIDARGRIVWEYINRYDEDHVAEITEARVYPASYFDVTDWSCP